MFWNSGFCSNRLSFTWFFQKLRIYVKYHSYYLFIHFRQIFFINLIFQDISVHSLENSFVFSVHLSFLQHIFNEIMLCTLGAPKAVTSIRVRNAVRSTLLKLLQQLLMEGCESLNASYGISWYTRGYGMYSFTWFNTEV